MSSNKVVKEKLIQLFGPECFIDKLSLRPPHAPIHYKSKGQKHRMKELTYHHIRLKSQGGPATIYNGALLSAENHQWFHQQSKKHQEEMNEAFQEYKLKELQKYHVRYTPKSTDDQIMRHYHHHLEEQYQECSVDIVELEPQEEISINCLDLTPTENELVFSVYENMTEEEIEEYKKHKQERLKRVCDARFSNKGDLPEGR